VGHGRRSPFDSPHQSREIRLVRETEMLDLLVGKVRNKRDRPAFGNACALGRDSIHKTKPERYTEKSGKKLQLMVPEKGSARKGEMWATQVRSRVLRPGHPPAKTDSADLRSKKTFRLSRPGRSFPRFLSPSFSRAICGASRREESRARRLMRGL
jgi:hypothetical protein